jgi:tRNA-dihydrouridine synthase B
MNLDSRELGRVFLAPLSGVADSPFRRICKRFGADTVYTEMVSAQGLTRGSLISST